MGTQVSGGGFEINTSRAAWAAVYMCSKWAEHRNDNRGFEYFPYYFDGILPEEVLLTNLMTPQTFEEYKTFCIESDRSWQIEDLSEDDFYKARRFIASVSAEGDGFGVSY